MSAPVPVTPQQLRSAQKTHRAAAREADKAVRARRRLMLRARRQGASYTWIADALGISAERVRQMMNTAKIERT